VSEFQVKVKQRFKELYATLKNVEPHVIDVTGKSIESLGADIDAMVLERLQSDERRNTTETLW
jgi:thymidylate kinase